MLPITIYATTLSCWHSDGNIIGTFDSSDILIYYNKLNSNTSFEFISGLTESDRNALGISIKWSTSNANADMNIYGGTIEELSAISGFEELPTTIGGRTLYTTQTLSETVSYGGVSKKIYKHKKINVCIIDRSDLYNYTAMVATHEMGHGLGWRGHMSDNNSTYLMSASMNTSSPAITTLTSQEIDHLAQVY